MAIISSPHLQEGGGFIEKLPSKTVWFVAPDVSKTVGAVKVDGNVKLSAPNCVTLFTCAGLVPDVLVPVGRGGTYPFLLPPRGVALVAWSW